MKLLADKVAIVTGASSGIGYAAAKLFAQEGAAVVAAGRNSIGLECLQAEIKSAGGLAVTLTGDVRDESHARQLVQVAVSEFGGLDVAFNNAGQLGAMGPTAELELRDWESTIGTNLTGAFLGAKHQLPAMVARGGGSLIFTSTFVGHTIGFSGMTAYAASKAGLVGLAKALATEFGGKRIRVNALLPGGTDTPMGRMVAHTPEATNHVRQLHALKRLAEPEEIAKSALFLASDLSTFMTGAVLLVDGGISVTRE